MDLLNGAIVNADESLTAYIDDCECCQQVLDELTSGDQWRQMGDILRAGDDRDSLSTFDLPPRPAGVSHDVYLSYLAPTDDPQSLGRIGSMEVQGVIGHGGAGIVYKAHDSALGRNVAIKLLNPSLSDGDAARTRFAREARAMAAIAHEHIVPVFAVAEHNEIPYFVMEYVPGGTLSGRLQRGPLDLIETIRVGLQIARGLAAAHRQGVVHRDVKPSNLLLDPGVERVRAADFGLARAPKGQTVTGPGTPGGPAPTPPVALPPLA